MSIFNLNNKQHEAGYAPLILGEALGLYDNINVTHPKIFEFYKKQKAMDWSENEVDLVYSRQDVRTAPKSITDIMLINLAFQWELDSVAMQSTAVLLAPFITNSEFWASNFKNTEIEILHSLSYSEIVRNCIDDPKEIFDLALKNEQVINRGKRVQQALEELEADGALYRLGKIENDDDLFATVVTGLFAIYLLERVQFATSFASTFAVVESGYFTGIGQLIQKIMLDELTVHAPVIEYALNYIFQNDPRGRKLFSNKTYINSLKEMTDEVLLAEYQFAEYVMSEGRSVVGLTVNNLKGYADYNANYAYTILGMGKDVKQPLHFIDKWLNIDNSQIAKQETDATNYLLAEVIDDVDGELDL